MPQAAPEYPRVDTAGRERAAEVDSGRPVVESTTEARQGVTGHGARYVLMFSLGGVVLAFVVIYALFWGF
jgi:hypothetical protein